MDLRETVEYKDFDFDVVVCPICGEEVLDNHSICLNCGWEYDEFNLLDEDYSYCNHSTVKEYRDKYQKSL